MSESEFSDGSEGGYGKRYNRMSYSDDYIGVLTPEVTQ